MKKELNFYFIGLLLSVLCLSSCSDNDTYSPEFKLALSADTLSLQEGDCCRIKRKRTSQRCKNSMEQQQQQCDYG